jgi:ubiquinone/menaquinone biosynthesis C-methylase UbiE
VNTSFPDSRERNEKSEIMLEKMETKTNYDRSALIYEQRYRNIQWEKYTIMIENPLHGRILDLGCGTGLLADFLQRKIYGVDISFQMVKRAKPKELVVEADIDFLPFRNSVFDVVLSFTSLQNLPSLDYIFEEVRRVLKGNCPFIFTILKKKYSPIEERVESYFKIRKIRECGEDIGFVCC